MTLKSCFEWFLIIILIISALVPSTFDLLIFHLLTSFIMLGFLLFAFTLPKNFRITLPDVLAFLLAAIPIISWYTSINRYHTAMAVIHHFSLFMFYLIARTYLRKRTLLTVAVIIPIVISMYSFWQYSVGFQYTSQLISESGFSSSVQTALQHRIQDKRLFATFALPNSFAGYLIILLTLQLGFFFTQPKEVRKVIIFSAILVIANLMLTRSLGAFLSLGVTLLIITIIKRDIFLQSRFLALILAIALILPLAEGYRRYGRLTSFKPTDSIFQRSLYFEAAANIFQDNRLLGTGAGTFGDI